MGHGDEARVSMLQTLVAPIKFIFFTQLLLLGSVAQ